MSIETQLRERSNNTCELCSSNGELFIYPVPPDRGPQASHSILVCDTCLSQLEGKSPLEMMHWTCLKTSMWSEIPVVQVVSWRMLNRLSDETWAVDALEMMYLDDELLQWAKAAGDHERSAEAEEVHRDCNGAILQNGDSVTLIKSLDVKGSQINAKIGTTVKNIKLVSDNTEQIEGKVEGQQIVILTKYVRKA